MQRLLIADDDADARASIAAIAKRVIDDVTILEARDGAEAIQVGLQQQPTLALIDVHMPRLGGLEAALVLRNLLPNLVVALGSDDRFEQEERSRGHGLMFFGTRNPHAAVHWLARTATLVESEHADPSRRPRGVRSAAGRPGRRARRARPG